MTHEEARRRLAAVRAHGAYWLAIQDGATDPVDVWLAVADAVLTEDAP